LFSCVGAIDFFFFHFCCYLSFFFSSIVATFSSPSFTVFLLFLQAFSFFSSHCYAY
jgi:hypothetical protein